MLLFFLNYTRLMQGKKKWLECETHFFKICASRRKLLSFEFNKFYGMGFNFRLYQIGFLAFMFWGLVPQNCLSQPFLDACFTSPAVGTSFASTANVFNRDADLLRWTGAAWTGGWGGANITLPPPGAIVNTRAIWSGDGTVWTTGGEGFGLRLTSPIVTGTTYTFAFQRVSHGTGQNGSFRPTLYTNAGGAFGTSYGQIPSVGTAWTNSTISFTAVGGSSGHTFVYFHNSTGSGMFLACTTVILPMAFSNLQALPNGDQIHLSWQVQDEGNYSHHAVERSVNGYDFIEVGSKESVRAGSQGHLYSTKDDVSQLSFGTSLYYRIRSVDQEGLEALSPVVATKVMSRLSFEVTMVPNPQAQGGLATANFHSEAAGIAHYTVQDMQGRLMQQGEWSVAPGLNSIPLDGRQFARGIYLLRVQVGSKTATCKWSVD